MVKLRQCRCADQRFPEFHCPTHARIQHPRRDHRHLATRPFDVNKLPANALIAPDHANRAPTEAVPAVMELNRLPDMGRMSER